MAAGMGQLIVYDTMLSFMWVWSSVIVKVLVHQVLGLAYHGVAGEFFRCFFSVLNMFFFAYMGKVTHGGSYNPLTILASAIFGDFPTFLVTVGARIPFQVFGSIIGVRMILQTFPKIGRGYQLAVNIHQGALTEGLLTFAIVFISLYLSRNIPGSFYRKTWMTSVSKLALHILGSDLTGGCMNPAAAMGWAYARGDHITKEHTLVYWLAPVEATLLAVWTFKVFARPSKQDIKKKTN